MLVLYIVNYQSCITITFGVVNVDEITNMTAQSLQTCACKKVHKLKNSESHIAFFSLENAFQMARNSE